jgi:hypothetical protein
MAEELEAVGAKQSYYTRSVDLRKSTILLSGQPVFLPGFKPNIS